MTLSRAVGARAIDSAPVESEVERLKRGDQDAWAALFEAEYDRVFRLLVSLVGDVHAAEDLASQVFFEAVAGIRRYRDRGRPVPAWLFAIARHRATDWQRSRRRLERAHAAMTAPADRPDFAAAGIAEIVSTLKPEQAEVLHLRFVEGLEVEEIATILGRSGAAVRQLQHRALNNLRARFAGARPGEPV